MAVIRGRRVRDAGMGGLVQQPAALGAHWQHPAGRSRGTLLRHAGTTGHGGVTQTKSPPANPGRFNAEVWATHTHHIGAALCGVKQERECKAFARANRPPNPRTARSLPQSRCENHRFRSRGRLGRLLIGIPIVSDPRHTTGAAKPLLGVAFRFKSSKGDDAAAWKARLYTPSTPDPSGVEGDLIRKLGHARQYAPCMSR